MNVTVQIPDDLARRLTESGGDLSRRALEAFALEEFKNGHLTRPELRQLLGYETQAAADGFLNDRGIFDGPALHDVDEERAPRKFEKESGLWVLRTGQPIDPAVIDRTLIAIREERDLGNLGRLP
jgi:hypothetical protein